MKKLTIAIPTYNRNLILKKNLKKILAQDLSSVEILILDNNSTRPVIEDIKEEISTYNINYNRNPFNIGATANIAKCIETATTKWVWVLGDDDIPEDNCIKQILEDIETYNNYFAINYKTILAKDRNKNNTTSGFIELIEELDSFGNLLLISTNIYNRELLIPQLMFAYTYIYSEAVHIALLFASIVNQGKVLLSNENIVEWNIDDTGTGWSYEKLGCKIAVLNDFSVIHKVSNKVAKKLAQHIQTHIMPLPMLLKIGVKKAEINEKIDQNDRYFIEQGFYRNPLQQGSFTKLAGLSFYRTLINSRVLLRILYKLKYTFKQKV